MKLLIALKYDFAHAATDLTQLYQEWHDDRYAYFAANETSKA
jgi:hypothetical protein